MSDTSYVADYKKGCYRQACGERYPKRIREQLVKEGIYVPLRVIRHVWTDPFYRGFPITQTDVIAGFMLFDGIVKNLTNNSPKWPGLRVTGILQGLMRDFHDPEKGCPEVVRRLTDIGFNDASFCATYAAIMVAIQASYVVPINQVVAVQS